MVKEETEDGFLPLEVSIRLEALSFASAMPIQSTGSSSAFVDKFLEYAARIEDYLVNGVKKETTDGQ